jgi:multidrug efflux system outer membrane protein
MGMLLSNVELFRQEGKQCPGLISRAIVAVALLAMSGCAMGPKYTQPEAPIPAEWPVGNKVTDKTAKPVSDILWREFFIDEQLRKLIAIALDNNRDMKVATLNIERFRELYSIRRADLFPKIDGSAGANLQRVPADLSTTGKAMNTEQYSVGLGVSSYELDLFGRVRSLKDQALEQYFATEHAQRSVRSSLIAQVAAAWLTLAADIERLQLARDTLINQQKSYDLIKSRYDAGVSSALALNQARTIVDAARVDIARFTATVAQDENALNFIVGAKVPAELLPKSLSEKLIALNDVIPGLPSEVLLKRPDILQAEGQLKMANANIGAARAAFFPRIILAGSTGYGSTELSGLFKGDSFTWSFVPRITLPIFDGGSNAANLRVAEVDRDIALAQYEKAIQAAFREVADALAQRGTIDEQLSAQQSLTNATAESYKLSYARYEKGIDSYLQALDAQRSMYGAQQNLIGVRLTRLANLVTLYKALGGGAEK